MHDPPLKPLVSPKLRLTLFASLINEQHSSIYLRLLIFPLLLFQFKGNYRVINVFNGLGTVLALHHLELNIDNQCEGHVRLLGALTCFPSSLTSSRTQIRAWASLSLSRSTSGSHLMSFFFLAGATGIKYGRAALSSTSMGLFEPVATANQSHTLLSR